MKYSEMVGYKKGAGWERMTQKYYRSRKAKNE